MSTSRFPVVAVSVLAIGACERSPRPIDGDPATTITIITCCGVRELGYQYSMPARHLLFLPLFTTDRTGEIRGRLVQRWEQSEDQTTWTYHLRTDVRWHDGVPVTAADIEFTFALLSHPEVLWKPPGGVTVSVHDDSTLTVRYNDRMENPLDEYDVFYPKHLLAGLDPAGMAEWEFWDHPVGNGPFRYVRHVPGVVVELEANPDFFAGRPQIDRVLLRHGGSSDVTELLAGNADVRSWPANPQTVQALASDERFRLYYSISGGRRALWWNHRSPLFSDVRVRRALSMAIDRDVLVAVNTLPPELVLGWDVPATPRQVRRGDVLPPLPYDPARARALLDTAGWRDDDGDGVRERDGAAFRFTALTEPGDPSAVVVQEQLRRVGVEMELASMEISPLRDRVRAGDFEAAFQRFTGYDDWNGPTSVNGYDNPLLASMWAEALTTWDPEARDRKHREVMHVFQADMPLAILFYQADLVVAQRRVRGLATPYRSYPLLYMDELWIEEQGAETAEDSR